MKSGFSDPIAVRKESPKDTSERTLDKVFNFEQPQYDKRSSCFINAGTHYGVGHNQPVGHEGNPKQRVPTMPFGRPTTMRIDEAG